MQMKERTRYFSEQQIALKSQKQKSFDDRTFAVSHMGVVRGIKSKKQSSGKLPAPIRVGVFFFSSSFSLCFIHIFVHFFFCSFINFIVALSVFASLFIIRLFFLCGTFLVLPRTNRYVPFLFYIAFISNYTDKWLCECVNKSVVYHILSVACFLWPKIKSM